MEISGQLCVRQGKGPDINRLGGRAGYKAVADAMRKKKILSSSQESNPSS